jgi:eukaryotic-like serine/threonine-protein kinase
VLEAGSSIAGRYRLERQIARGGMGSVWLATHLQLDAPVAIKLMTTSMEPSLVARFEREAKACARLNSPHIVKVSDFGVESDAPFMVMELLTGEDLGVRLKRDGKIPFDRLAVMADQIGRGLGVAHEAGIVHRDLKPANVFLARTGREEVIKLLDFGVARETEQRMVDDLTTSGLVLGSPHHMSPEQAAGESVDGRSDLWSFGVLLYQALTGARPFAGPNLTAILLAITSKSPAPPSTLMVGAPAGVDAFFERALHRDRNQRFQTAEEMAAAFAALDSSERAPSLAFPSLTPAPISSDSGSPLMTPEPLQTSTGSRIIPAVERGVKAPSVGGRAAFLLVPVLVGAAALSWLATRDSSTSSDTPVAAISVIASSTAPPTATGPVVEVAQSASASALASVPLAIASSAAPKIPPAHTTQKAPPNSTTNAPSKANTSGCPSGKVADPFTGLCVTRH